MFSRIYNTSNFNKLKRNQRNYNPSIESAAQVKTLWQPLNNTQEYSYNKILASVL